jgi:hypothetical protein
MIAIQNKIFIFNLVELYGREKFALSLKTRYARKVNLCNKLAAYVFSGSHQDIRR